MMVTEHIRNYVGKEDLSVVDAMSQIDLNSKGILFIVDDEDRLVGTLTDGDIRRWILSKGDLLSPVSMVMNEKYFNPPSEMGNRRSRGVA